MHCLQFAGDAPVNYVRSITREGGPPPPVPGPDFDDGKKDYPDYVTNYNSPPQSGNSEQQQQPQSLGTVRLGAPKRQRSNYAPSSQQRANYAPQPQPQQRRRFAKKAEDAIKDIVLNYDGRQTDGGEVAKTFRGRGESDNQPQRQSQRRGIGPQRRPSSNINPETGRPKTKEEREYEAQMNDYLTKKVNILGRIPMSMNKIAILMM